MTIPSGSVLFCDCPNPSCLIERVAVQVSESSLVHAAVLFDGVLYESTWPRVRKTDWNLWLPDFRAGRFGSETLFWMVPNDPYSPEALAVMLQEATAHLGEHYKARGAWQDRDIGIYCSWYVSMVLEKGGRMTSAGHDDLPHLLLVQVQDWSHRVEQP